MILAGEIKDANMSSFSSDFQTLIKHLFALYSLWIVNEFEKYKSNTRRSFIWLSNNEMYFIKHESECFIWNSTGRPLLIVFILIITGRTKVIFFHYYMYNVRYYSKPQLLNLTWLQCVGVCQARLMWHQRRLYLSPSEGKCSEKLKKMRKVKKSCT